MAKLKDVEVRYRRGRVEGKAAVKGPNYSVLNQVNVRFPVGAEYTILKLILDFEINDRDEVIFVEGRRRGAKRWTDISIYVIGAPHGLWTNDSGMRALTAGVFPDGKRDAALKQLIFNGQLEAAEGLSWAGPSERIERVSV